MGVRPESFLDNPQLLYILLQLHISPEIVDTSSLEDGASIPTFDFGTTIKFSKSR